MTDTNKEEQTFQINDIVMIKENAIEDGILKDNCKNLLNKKGIVTSLYGVGCCNDEIKVNFNDGFDNWIMPISSLKFIEHNKETFESYIHSVECGLVGGNKFDWQAVLKISKQLHDKEIKELQAEIEYQKKFIIRTMR